MDEKELEHRIFAALEKARTSFWQVIANEFPEALTGDMDPVDQFDIDNAMHDAVINWVGWNVPV